jgi:uncharacterized protein (DUF1501 family)
MIGRRSVLGAAAATAAGSSLLGGAPPGRAAGEDYRALVVVFLMGGSDGHNTLVPTDAMYGDYQSARANLALLRQSLVALPGSAAGHAFGLHPALAPLVPLYAQQRLAFIANVGPLVVPTTALQARLAQVDLPPFLLSHSDQVAIQQGWTVRDDTSGWAGRALELLPSALRNPLAAVTMDNHRTLVLGRRTPVSFMPKDGARYWGPADLTQPQTPAAQSINRMAQWQFANAYEAEYARTFGFALADATRLTQALQAARAPAADFGSDEIGQRLRALASVLPVFRAQGFKRQVFLVSWGQFDTHANQRGSDPTTQDTQFIALAKALAAFDETNRANGMDMAVVTLMMSDFGRTVRPGSGGGSEHAWGNHWFAFGGPVNGATVHGVFPSPVLGGADDGDPGGNGRHVPTIATDQVGATLMNWIGLPASLYHEVFPDLVNFPVKTIPLLRT